MSCLDVKAVPRCFLCNTHGMLYFATAKDMLLVVTSYLCPKEKKTAKQMNIYLRFATREDPKCVFS